jgi:hypothetical protein
MERAMIKIMHPANIAFLPLKIMNGNIELFFINLRQTSGSVAQLDRATAF